MSKDKFVVLGPTGQPLRKKRKAYSGEMCVDKKVTVGDVSNVPDATCIIRGIGPAPMYFNTFFVYGLTEQGDSQIVYCELEDFARGVRKMVTALAEAIEQAPPEMVDKVEAIWGRISHKGDFDE